MFCRPLLVFVGLLLCVSAQAHTRVYRSVNGSDTAVVTALPVSAAALFLRTAITGKLSNVPLGRPTLASSSSQQAVPADIPRGTIGPLFGVGATTKSTAWMTLIIPKQQGQ